MFSCIYSESFWKEVIKWLGSFQINLEHLNEFSILFVALHNTQLKLINYLIISAKQVIYKCRRIEIKPNINLSLLHIHRVASVEQSIAERRGALNIYYDKWNNLLVWLQRQKQN